MPWLSREFDCEWCEKRFNAKIDKCNESEVGTLCDGCEEIRIEEEKYEESQRANKRIDFLIAKAKKPTNET